MYTDDLGLMTGVEGTGQGLMAGVEGTGRGLMAGVEGTGRGLMAGDEGTGRGFQFRTLKGSVQFSKKARPGPDISPPNVDISRIKLSSDSLRPASSSTQLYSASSRASATSSFDAQLSSVSSGRSSAASSEIQLNSGTSSRPSSSSSGVTVSHLSDGREREACRDEGGVKDSTESSALSTQSSNTRQSLVNISTNKNSAQSSLRTSNPFSRLNEKEQYAALLKSYVPEGVAQNKQPMRDEYRAANHTQAQPITEQCRAVRDQCKSISQYFTANHQQAPPIFDLSAANYSFSREALPDFTFTGSDKISRVEGDEPLSRPSLHEQQDSGRSLAQDSGRSLAQDGERSQGQDSVRRLSLSSPDNHSKGVRTRSERSELIKSLSISQRQKQIEANDEPVLKDTSNMSNSPGERRSVQMMKEIQNSPYTSPNFINNLRVRTDGDTRKHAIKKEETVVQLHKMQRVTSDEDLRRQINDTLHITSRVAVPVTELAFCDVYEPCTSLELLEQDLERERELDRQAQIEIEEEEEVLPELSDEAERMVSSALISRPESEVLVEGFRLQITRRDVATLAGLNWLNDEVINFYLNLLMERGKRDNYPSVYSFNTFFYPKIRSDGHAGVRRWTKNVDIFSHDYIIIPVHLGMHWCLAVVDLREREIRYYDSMGGSNNEALNHIKSYLSAESKAKLNKDVDWSGWSLINVKDIPQQMNGSDCGMFTCKFAEYISRDAPITFTQADMPYFRRRMVYEILTKQLL